MRTYLAIAFACLLLVPAPAASGPGREDDKDRKRQTLKSAKQDRLQSLHDREGRHRERAAGTQSADEAAAPVENMGLEKRGRQSALDSGGPGDEVPQGAPALVLICHKPGTPAEKELLIPPAAVPGHLGHGDTLGACPGDQTPVE